MFFFFIESCSFIEPSDQWSYIILYEKKTIKQRVLYETIAYTSLFEENHQARISQVLVLPSH